MLSKVRFAILLSVLSLSVPTAGHSHGALVSTLIEKRTAQSGGYGRYLPEYDEVIALPPEKIICVADDLTSGSAHINVKLTAGSVYAVGLVKRVISQDRSIESYNEAFDIIMEREGSVDSGILEMGIGKALGVLLPFEPYEKRIQIEACLAKKAQESALISKMHSLVSDRQNLDAMGGNVSFETYGYPSLFSLYLAPGTFMTIHPQAEQEKLDRRAASVLQRPESLAPSERAEIARVWYEHKLADNSFRRGFEPYQKFRRMFLLWRNLAPTPDNEEGDDKMAEPLLSQGLATLTSEFIRENVENGSAEWPARIEEEFSKSLTPREKAFLDELTPSRKQTDPSGIDD